MSAAAGGGAAGAAAAAAAMANAIKASGAIVRVAPRDFLTILTRQDTPLVIHALAGVFTTKHRYLSSYKGLTFFAQSIDPLPIPASSEIVEARQIWIPS